MLILYYYLHPFLDTIFYYSELLCAYVKARWLALGAKDPFEPPTPPGYLGVASLF